MSHWVEVIASLRPDEFLRASVRHAEPSDKGRPLSHGHWAELLADFFFDEAHDGEEILFAVDGASLEEASGLDEDVAVDSLAEAVRYVIGAGWGVGCITSQVRVWRKSGWDGPHPALPLLALTVLAASRMGESQSFASHNYYRPLRRLLDPHDGETGPPGSLTTHVAHLWRDVTRWANEDLGGSRGRLVVREPGHHRYVGLAIQHALVKSSDLRQLDRFFRRIGLQPGEEVAPGELRRALAVWTSGRSESWARRLSRISSDEGLTEHCEALLEREAGRWDGRPRDPRTGRPIGRVRVGISSMRRPSIGLYVQWDSRLPETVQASIAGLPCELSHSDGWYRPSPLTDIDTGHALLAGFELRGDGFRFDLRPEEVFALAYDDDLGMWVSVDSMSYGDRYHLLVRSEVVSEVLRFAQSTSSSPSRLNERGAGWLPSGWRLISDVQIDSRPAVSPPTALGSLIPVGSGPRLRLLGGLPLTAARAVYLRGGEPSLALSTIAEDDQISVCRESTGQTERFRLEAGTNREFALRKLHLEPDTYDIRHGESRVTLQIVDGIAESAGPGAGTVVHRGARSVEVVGTISSGSGRSWEPLTVPAPRSGEATIVLGARPGEHHIVHVPVWLSPHLGFELTWRSMDAWPEFVPVWRLIRGPSGRYEAVMIDDIDPDAAPGASGTQWGRLIARTILAPSEPELAVRLWARYRTAAGVGT